MKGEIMRTLGICILLAVFAGCATPQDRRSNPPNMTIQSTKLSKDVAICISEKWENLKPSMGFSSPPVSVSLRKDGYSVAVINVSNIGGVHSTIALVDIFDKQSGSEIKYFKQFGIGLGDYEEALKGCQ